MANCLSCNKQLNGRQTKWCSITCAVREYARSHKTEAIERTKIWRKNNPDKCRLQDKNRYKKHSDKVIARILAERHFKLKDKSCELCGSKAECRHHKNYSKPLDIVFLCRTCHNGIHRSP